MLFSFVEVDWPLVADKFLGSLMTFLMVLAPGILLWFKSKAAENEAKAARIQGEKNEKKADDAAKAAVVAKDVASELSTKVDENTKLTQEIKEHINGHTEEIARIAKEQGITEERQRAKDCK